MSSARLEIRWRGFSDLTLEELYDVLRLRAEVFVVEQRCAFADPDGMDPQAQHLLANLDGELVGYARMFAPPQAGEGGARPALSCARVDGHVSIGRITTAIDVRGHGVGRAVVEAALAEASRAYPGVPIQIGAQAQLRKFYESYGFTLAGSAFLEDGITHLPMRKP